MNKLYNNFRNIYFYYLFYFIIKFNNNEFNTNILFYLALQSPV